MTQYALPLRLAPVFSADNFVVSTCNEDAWRWIHAWPDWPAHAMLLYGPKGCGKSHLGHVWSERADAALLAAAEARPDPGGMRGAWLVEDIDRLKDERWLLHLLNHTREQGATLLLTARAAPASLPFSLP